MALNFDVYLVGPATGITIEAFLEQLTRIFGSLPPQLLASVHAGEVVCIKRSVDLDVAQQFVLGVKGAGGRVEMVQAGAPAPGSAGFGSGRAASSGVSAPGVKGSVGRHASGVFARAGASTAPRQSADVPLVEGAPAVERTVSPERVSVAPAIGRRRLATLPLVAGLNPAAPEPVGQQAERPAIAAKPELARSPDTVRRSAAPRAMTGPFRRPGRADPLPQVVVQIRPVPAGHPIRAAEHQARVQPLSDPSLVCASIDVGLRLGVISSRQLGGQRGERLRGSFGLEMPPSIGFCGPDGDPVTVLTSRSVAWGAGRVALSEVEAVALQCDANEQPYVELTIGRQPCEMPPLSPFASFICAETIARLSPQHMLWAGPRAVRRLRQVFLEILRSVNRLVLEPGPKGTLARSAIGLIRHYYDLVQRLHAHWDRAGWTRWDSVRTVPLAHVLDMVTALETYELRDSYAEQTRTLAQQMLAIAQRVVAQDEGVLAIFEFRDPEWRPPDDLDPLSAGELYLLRNGLEDVERLRNATQQSFLLGAVGVLTSQRVLFVRPIGQGAQVSLPLSEIDNVELAPDEDVPIVELTATAEIAGRQRFRYHVSGNYLCPLAGTPRQQGQRLVDRILEAQSRFWELGAPPFSESGRLPLPPSWIAHEIATAATLRDRMLRALVALMREAETPREVRLSAKLGGDIEPSALRDLRAWVAKISHDQVSLSGLGERLFMLSDVFEGPRDAIFAAENGLLVVGFGPGRVGWRELSRYEIVQTKRGSAALIGTAGADLGLASKRPEPLWFVGRLLSTLQETYRLAAGPHNGGMQS